MENEEIAVQVNNVSKNFHYTSQSASSIKSLLLNVFKDSKAENRDVQHALKNISFEIKKGEFFGIVGRNGSGKSTLLKMIAGIYQPTKGKINVKGKLVPFIELGVGFNPELTGRENVYLNGALLGFSRKEVEAIYPDVVEFAELGKFMDQKLKNYSSGMQVRLAFSMAIRAKADILLIDEVLAVGDADFQRKCYEYFRQLKQKETTVIFVSHDMDSVRRFCDRAILVEDSEIHSEGSPTKVASYYHALFIDEGKDEKGKKAKPFSLDTKKRWGSQEAVFKKVDITKTKSHISVEASILANQNVQSVTCGIHVCARNGDEIFATNNKMLHIPDLHELKKGKKNHIHWKILNILNRGEYDITLTLVDSDGRVVDWYEGAATVSIENDVGSTTSILPPVTVTYDQNK